MWVNIAIGESKVAVPGFGIVKNILSATPKVSAVYNTTGITSATAKNTRESGKAGLVSCAYVRCLPIGH